MITQTSPSLERTLGAIAEHVDQFDAVYKQELQFGDCVKVRTLNSTYSIRVLGGDLYSVSGGWFDLEGLSPFKTSINGCTWGGRHQGGCGSGLWPASGVWQPTDHDSDSEDRCPSICGRAACSVISRWCRAGE